MPLFGLAGSTVNGRYHEGLYLLADVVEATISHSDSYSYPLRLRFSSRLLTAVMASVHFFPHIKEQ